MTAWNTILDAVLDVDKPLTYLLARIFRDNPIAIAEGSSGSPAIVGVNPESVTSVTSASHIAVLNIPAVDRLDLELNGIKPASSNAVLRIQASVNNGSSYLTGGIYHYMRQFIDTSGTPTQSGSSGNTHIQVTDTNHSNNDTLEGVITLFNTNSTTRTTGYYKLGYRKSSSVYVWVSGMFVIEPGGSAINALRFFFDTGNVATGKVTVRRFRPTVAN